MCEKFDSLGVCINCGTPARTIGGVDLADDKPVMVIGKMIHGKFIIEDIIKIKRKTREEIKKDIKELEKKYGISI